MDVNNGSTIDACTLKHHLPTHGFVHIVVKITVADSGGVRGVQMHPPLAASNVFLRT